METNFLNNRECTKNAFAKTRFPNSVRYFVRTALYHKPFLLFCIYKHHHLIFFYLYIFTIRVLTSRKWSDTPPKSQLYSLYKQQKIKCQEANFLVQF